MFVQVNLRIVVRGDWDRHPPSEDSGPKIKVGDVTTRPTPLRSGADHKRLTVGLS